MKIVDLVFVWQLHSERQIAWHGRRHEHAGEAHEIHYFISGDGSFRNGRRTFAITPGSLHFSPAGTIHQIMASENGRPISYYALLFDAAGDEELAGLVARLGPGAGAGDEPAPGPWDIGNSRRFFFADLLERHLSGRLGLEASARHLLLAFLWELAAGGDRPSDAAGDANVEKALAIMQGSIDRDLDLAELASRSGLSREHLVRVFSSRMGLSPMRYFGKLRIEAAHAMLSSTNLRICEIAERLRYSSQFNFSRAFRRMAGMSPSEYRARCLQRVDFAAKEEESD